MVVSGKNSEEVWHFWLCMHFTGQYRHGWSKSAPEFETINN